MADGSYSMNILSYANETGLLTLSLSGILDTANSSQFRTEANALTEKYPSLASVKLRIDGLRYVSSLGLGSVVNLMIDLKKKRVELYIANAQPQIFSVMELLGFTKFLNLLNE